MNIILADDERLNLDNLEYSISRVLPDTNYTSFIKASQAIEYIQNNRIGIAFPDINMHGIDGLTIARMTQELWPDVNIIFCTGYSEYARDALELNCSGYIMKPVTEEKVRKAMDNLRHPVVQDKKVTFRCFGNFEALCNGNPIWFKYNRTKEMLAYLVDRNGISVSLKELSAVLFEDDQHRSYMYQIRLDLVNTLTELGVEAKILSKSFLTIFDKQKNVCVI